MANMTKAQLEKELAKEKVRREEAERRAKEADEQLELAEERVSYYEDRAEGTDAPHMPHERQVEVDDDEGNLSVKQTEYREPRVVHDPFDTQNPHRIIANPPGFVLGWKNPLYRDGHRGWRGWRPVQFDDEIGRNLSKYLLDPPRRMEHAVDNMVRRGDTILCALEEDLWYARQLKRQRKAERLAAPYAADMTQDHVQNRNFLRADRDPKAMKGRSMTS